VASEISNKMSEKYCGKLGLCILDTKYIISFHVFLKFLHRVILGENGGGLADFSKYYELFLYLWISPDLTSTKS
jgi:hypothetical protein